MKIIVIGSGGTIGKALLEALKDAGHDATGLTRKELDLLALPDELPPVFHGAEVVYLCAARTRFIDCEADSDTYRVNVDAVVKLGQALKFSGARLVYLSSEAVEKALHTNYGMHKALAEMGLQAVGNPVIARLSKVEPHRIHYVCAFLMGLATARPGVYRWHA